MPVFNLATIKLGAQLVAAAYLGGRNLLRDPARYMLASNTITPNFRANTADPETTPAQKYHVSALSFDLPLWSANHLRFAWQNAYTNNTGATPAEIAAPTQITLRAAIFNGNTFVRDVLFGGLAVSTLAAGGLVWCDPIDVAGLPTSNLFIRTFSDLPNGGQRPGRRQTTDNTAGFSSTALRSETVEATALAYLTGSAITSNSGFPNSYAFGPVCQAADNWDGRSCVLVVGDSIAAGNDNAIGKSWITDALAHVSGGVMAYYNMAIHGTKPSNQSTEGTYGHKAAIIDSLITINSGSLPMTHIISEMGVNDASGTNVAALQAKMQTWLDYIHGKWPTALLIQTTYTPRVTPDANTLQTDAAEQLVDTVTPEGTDRWGVADWIKTNPAPLSGHIDVRAAWTGAADGTTWAIPAWSAVLTADANIGATSIQVDVAPPTGIVPVLTPGASATVESTNIPIGTVTGSGPYTVVLNKALTKNHTSGATVKASPSIDGLHPEEGYTTNLARDVVITAKAAVLS